MGSVVDYEKVNRITGKRVKLHRALIRRKGFASKSKIFGSLAEANKWIRDNEAETTLTKAGSGKTLKVLIELFVPAPKIRGTKYWRPEHLDFWSAQLGNMKAAEISRGDINGAVAVLRDKPAMRSTPSGPVPTKRKLTPATVNRYLASLASVFNFAMEREIIEVHPMKGGKVKKLRESAGRTRTLDEDEEQRLYAAARASSWPLMYLLLRMVLTTGARRSEVLNLTWQQIKLDQSIAVLGKTKNGHARSLPLVSDVRELLAGAAKVRPLKGDFVFFDPRHPERVKTIDTAWKTCRADAGLLNDREDPLDRVVLHTGRHTAVTKMLRGGANLAQAAAVSGHRTLAMLKKYEHLAADDAVLLAEKHLGGGGKK